MRTLLVAGADPTAQDAQHGRTALHTAAMANDVDLVKVRYIAFLLNTECFNSLCIFCSHLIIPEVHLLLMRCGCNVSFISLFLKLF